jgi:hypothetical protein
MRSVERCTALTQAGEPEDGCEWKRRLGDRHADPAEQGAIGIRFRQRNQWK